MIEVNGRELRVEANRIKRAIQVLKVINHRLRQRMLHLIDKNERLTVTELFGKLGLEQSVVSQHLALMRKEGFVKTQREGKFIYYSVDYKRIDEVNKIASCILC